MIRSLLFAVAYWGLSIAYTLMAVAVAVLPGRRATGWIIRRYVRRMVQAMRLLAGIRLTYRGEDQLPSGAFILAAKHQSWGDGYSIYDRFPDLAFVTGDHLERFPLMSTVLAKLGAIVVHSCGGRTARDSLKLRGAQAHAEGRRILIFPEGHLAAVDTKYRYRSGVWHMYRDFDLPVVPVATNLGLFWPEQRFRKYPGSATLAFLHAIEPGLEKAEFLARLETAVEDATADLVAQARGSAPVVARQKPAPDTRRSDRSAPRA